MHWQRRPRRTQRHRIAAMRAVAALALAAAAAGCQTQTRWIDPPVQWTATGNDCLGDGSEEFTLGMYREQLFTPFGDEPEAAIRTGFQGGVWCMPAVRVLGTEPAVKVIGEIEVDGKLVARSVYAHYELKLAPDGKCEEQQLPIQILDAFAKEGALTGLFGKKATLRVILQNKLDGKQVKASASIILVEG